MQTLLLAVVFACCTQADLQAYAEAAKKGDGKAAYQLAEIYDKGLGGVKRDPELAHKWYNAARNLGYPPLVGDFPQRPKSK